MYRYILFLFLVLFFTSCSRYHYSPDEGNMLALREKGDIHISGDWKSLKFKDSSNYYNFQAGYSPIPHLGISTSYFWLKDQDKNDPTISGKGHIWNTAVGGYYFLPPIPNPFNRFRRGRKREVGLDEDLLTKSGNLVEIYFGHSRGRARTFYQPSGIIDLNFQKNYVQFGFHGIRKTGGLSYIVRLGNVKYTSANAFGSILPKDLENVRLLENKNKFGVVETTIRFHFGIRHVRYFANLSILNEEDDFTTIGVDNSNFSLGLIVEIDEFFRKKKENQLLDEYQF